MHHRKIIARIRLVLVIICGSHLFKAQDLIVTTGGDSINCKIDRYKENHVYFRFRQFGQVMDSSLSYSKVRKTLTNFYVGSVLKADQPRIKRDRRTVVRAGLFGGFSSLTAPVSPDIPAQLEQYYHDLKSGKHFGGDLSLFFGGHGGAGVRYSAFRTQNKMDNMAVIDPMTGQVFLVPVADDISIKYYGLGFLYRTRGRSAQLVMTGHAGPLLYRNNALFGVSYLVTGTTVGGGVEATVDINLGEHLSLGLGCNYTVGSLRTFTMEDHTGTREITLPDGRAEGLSHFSFSVGLRFVSRRAAW